MEWINCATCCWCAYQGDREDFNELRKIFLVNPHPHGAPEQCIGCKIESGEVKITWT